MMTVITRVELPEGVAAEWDAAMRERMQVAESLEGWIGGQILIPVDALDHRLIVGVWETRAHWEAWHTEPAFQETRRRLGELGAPEGDTSWHEVVYDARGR